MPQLITEAGGADDLCHCCDLAEISWGLTTAAEAWWVTDVTPACPIHGDSLRPLPFLTDTSQECFPGKGGAYRNGRHLSRQMREKAKEKALREADSSSLFSRHNLKVVKRRF